MRGDTTLELQIKVREDFIITEKALLMAFSWLKVPTSPFTFKTKLRHYADADIADAKVIRNP